MKRRSGPRSEATKAIFAFIQENQPVAQSVLNDKFRAEAAAADMSVGSWLKGRLDNMAYANFIAFTPNGWTVGVVVPLLQASKQAKPKARRKADPLATSVAEPRRTSMFEGGNYVPPVQVLRAGSEDYAGAPSLINGQPRAYRRAW
jgi:hypothetical protein